MLHVDEKKIYLAALCVAMAIIAVLVLSPPRTERQPARHARHARELGKAGQPASWPPGTQDGPGLHYTCVTPHTWL